ncbi:MAG: phage tail protein [Candidatus Didemnitutus sp.]|nr:phage tail protein [Candidatus Didemnitutus sp.]
MSEPFLGEIKSVAFNFAPRNYAFCAGQLMSIAQNSALFALLGTTFGGDGMQTFGLPNLGGRVAIGKGRSPGTSLYDMGEAAGSETVTILTSQMPMHNHVATTNVTTDISGLTATTTVHALTAPSTTSAVPTGNMLTVGTTGGASPVSIKPYAASGSGTDTTMAAQMSPTVLGGSIAASATTTVGSSGSSQPVAILQPYVVVNYIIATAGIFPARN